MGNNIIQFPKKPSKPLDIEKLFEQLREDKLDGLFILGFKSSDDQEREEVHYYSEGEITPPKIMYGMHCFCFNHFDRLFPIGGF